MNGLFKVAGFNIEHSLLVCFLTIVEVSGTTHYCQQGNTVKIQGEPSGNIVTRQQGNSFYGDNLACSWMIDAGSNNHIKLTVTKLDLQWSPSYTTCEAYDHLKILNGSTADSEFLQYMCHSRNPYYILSPGRYLYLHFYSDKKNFYDKVGIELKFETYGDTTCPPRWRNFNSSPDKCHFLMEQPAAGATFSQAQQYCTYSQANLVTVETIQEFDAIQDYGENIAQIDQMWIGLNDIGEEDKYTWLDRTSKQTSKLDTSTNSELNDCAVQNFKDKKWELRQCNRDKYFFMCEKNRVGLTPLYSIPEAEEDETGKGSVTLVWAIVVGILGGIACVIFAIVCYCCCIRKNKSGSRSKNYRDNSRSRTDPPDTQNSSATCLNEIRPSAPPLDVPCRTESPQNFNRPTGAPPSYQESLQHEVIK